MGAHRSVAAAATGTISAITGSLYSVGLTGTAAGTVTVQTGGTAGGTICRLTCAANGSAQRTWGADGVAYETPLVATFAGTGARADFELDL